MPHATHIWMPMQGGQVILRFYVPSDIVTPDTDEVFISAGAEGVIRVPQTLVAESDDPDEVVFEAQMPSDVAAAVRSVCEVVFGQIFVEE